MTNRDAQVLRAMFEVSRNTAPEIGGWFSRDAVVTQLLRWYPRVSTWQTRTDDALVALLSEDVLERREDGYLELWKFADRP